MYEAFYELSEKPFSILPDPDLVYWSRAHRMAFAMMEYGVLNQAGFTVVTGEVGCGKTTLVRKLLRSLGDSVTVGLLSNTGESNTDLLRWVLMAFGQSFEAPSKVALFKQFQDFLVDEYANGRHVLLIIDEAQNLQPPVLEELRMLSNINADKDQLLQLILVGQPQLKTVLQRPELWQFAQRISSDYHLGRLGLSEVDNYVNHRLKTAGAQRRIFTEDATRLIARLSGGVPRTINIICDTSLVYGFATESPLVGPDLVEQVIRDKRRYGVFSSPDWADPSSGTQAPPPRLMQT